MALVLTAGGRQASTAAIPDATLLIDRLGRTRTAAELDNDAGAFVFDPLGRMQAAGTYLTPAGG